MPVYSGSTIPRSRLIRVVAFVVSLMFLIDGCKSQAAPILNVENPGQATAVTSSVDDLVAPVALYPDQLLGQLLLMATNPQEVLDLGNWLIQNPNLKPADAPAAAKKAGFSTSAQYMAAFPQVVDQMCQQMDWTKQLGAAFKADQKSVMDAVQRKRAQAQQMGNLKTSPQMTVTTKTDNGQQVVQIAPTNPQVVYVPQYNVTNVYTQPAPPPTQTTVVQQQSSGVSTGAAVAIGLLSFGVGMAVGSAFHDDYYPYPAWGYGGMWYGGHPYPPPPYRPPVYPGYRPVYRYAPPPNYHWSQYNQQVNIHVNNNNFYNNFHGGGGYHPGGGPGPEPGYHGGTQPLHGGTQYLGAHPQNAPGTRPGAGMAGVNPNVNRGGGASPANRGNLGAGGAGTRNPGLSQGARPESRPGGQGFNQPAANRPAQQQNFNRNEGGDRGFGSNTNSFQNRQPQQPQQSHQFQQNRGNSGGLFGGDNAHAERNASARGRASMGGGGGGRFGGRRR